MHNIQSILKYPIYYQVKQGEEDVNKKNCHITQKIDISLSMVEKSLINRTRSIE